MGSFHFIDATTSSTYTDASFSTSSAFAFAYQVTAVNSAGEGNASVHAWAFQQSTIQPGPWTGLPAPIGIHDAPCVATAPEPPFVSIDVSCFVP